MEGENGQLRRLSPFDRADIFTRNTGEKGKLSLREIPLLPLKTDSPPYRLHEEKDFLLPPSVFLCFVHRESEIESKKCVIRWSFSDCTVIHSNVHARKEHILCKTLAMIPSVARICSNPPQRFAGAKGGSCIGTLKGGLQNSSPPFVCKFVRSDSLPKMREWFPFFHRKLQGWLLLPLLEPCPRKRRK